MFGVCGTAGWSQLFNRFDTDGNGRLSPTEFIHALRTECKLGEEELSDVDLHQVFEILDADSEGTIDAVRTSLSPWLSKSSEDFVGQ